MWKFSALILCFLINHSLQQSNQKPHIIFILVDDLGWNDVGFHGMNQFATPNIDALAYAGIILNEYYVTPLCSPTRAALMTARHPIHTGMWQFIIDSRQPYGLALDEKLLPQYLQELNYTTRMVGKWHLGFFREEYTPTFRGFDQHYGYFTGQLDYWTYWNKQFFGYQGFDMRNGTTVDREVSGEYATRHLTRKAVQVIENHDVSQPLFLYFAQVAPHGANEYDPMQAPQETIDQLQHIENQNRRTFAAMVKELDSSIGEIISALGARGMLNNSIVVLSTDNGGAAAGFNLQAGSNWPLRGNKDTVWQAGVRGTACIWSPLLPANPRVSLQVMHAQDWLPTLLGALGEVPNNSPYPLDGINAWGALADPGLSVRNEVLHMIDPIRGFAAITQDQWKLTIGTSLNGNWDDWYGPNARNGSYDVNLVQTSSVARALSSTSRPVPSNLQILRLRDEATLSQCPIFLNATACVPLSNEPCLFHLTSDPCEMNNLAASEPEILNQLMATLEAYNATLVPSRKEPVDPDCNPKYYNDTWVSWYDITHPQYISIDA